MLVLQTTELGKMWHSWVQATFELYGHSWVHNVPRTLLGQESPDNWKQVQESLNAKVRLYEL
ncbi:hypothetical protein, partial [Parahaliea mediterranea]